MARRVSLADAAHYHRGWSGRSRSEIIRHLVVAVDRHDTLQTLAYGAATAIREILAASTAHISLIVGDQFLDVVNVGEIAPDQVVLPVDQYYALSSYPATAERLLSHRGYLSTELLEVVAEYIRQSPRPVQPCFMGVPMVAQGKVLGEVFVTRSAGEPPFTWEDLDLAVDLGTVVGARVPHVLAMESLTS